MTTKRIGRPKGPSRTKVAFYILSDLVKELKRMSASTELPQVAILEHALKELFKRPVK